MEQWTCKHCGEKNDEDCDFCFGCGAYDSDEKARIKRQPNRPPADLGEPVSDPLFGDILWDAKSNAWVGVYPAGAGFPFRLVIDAESKSSRAIGQGARRVMQHIVTAQSTLATTVAAAMLGEAIEWAKGSAEWDEEYEKLTVDDYARMLAPDTISIDADGTAEVSFVEEEIFGHWVVANVTPSGEIGEFRIEG